MITPYKQRAHHVIKIVISRSSKIKLMTKFAVKNKKIKSDDKVMT